MGDRVRIGIVGLDSPHTPIFASWALHPEFSARAQLVGVHAGEITDFPPSTGRTAQVTRQVHEMGVAVETDLDVLADRADLVIVTAVDPRVHPGLLSRLVRPGLAVLVDTRLALTVAEAERAFAAADRVGAILSCASPRRFVDTLPTASAAVDRIRIEGSLAPQHPLSPMAWYGFHHADLLVAYLGSGLRTVSTTTDVEGVLTVDARWAGERHGAIIGRPRLSAEVEGEVSVGGAVRRFAFRAGEAMFGAMLARAVAAPDLAGFPGHEEMLDVVRIVELATRGARDAA